MAELTTMKFDGTRGMHEHILEMSNLVAKLKALGMNVDESFLVQFILNSLPLQDMGHFKFITTLLRTSGILKQQGHHSIHLISKGASKKWKKPKKGKRRNHLRSMVPLVHVSNSMQGFLTIQTLNQNESSIVMGNGVKVPVVATGTFRLFLDTDCYLDLFQTLYVPSISRNLVSISKLDLEVDALEVYIVEVERQLDKKVKIIRSDRGGEYYGRNDGLGQCPGPFAKLLEKHESDYDIGTSKDPVSFSQAISCSDSNKWIDAMNDELKSMDQNKVWELVELPEGYKAVGCKWVFKTKRDSKGNIERHKARLVAKGFTQKGGIDYKETFSPVSKKDSLRIIMALVAHFDLELHQMDVKTAFLNGSLEEKVYMDQPEGLAIVDTIEKPLKIYCDNSALYFSPRTTNTLMVLNTWTHGCDPLTKGLPPKTFKEHVKRMGLDCNP
ncbi:hypothetical protein AAG906_015153 [Vitis piasezkii]